MVFAYSGAVVDPATNCDESGRDCAPWLVHAAFWPGVTVCAGCIAALIRNPRWGSRLNAQAGDLTWWHDGHPQRRGSISLADIARVHVRNVYDGQDTIAFYDRSGAVIPFPASEVLPYALPDWARDFATAFPHIKVEVEEVP